MPTVITMGTQLYGPWSYQVERSRVSWSRSAVVKTAEHALRRKQPHIFLPPTAMNAQRYERRIGNHTVVVCGGYTQSGCASESTPQLEDYDVAANFPDLQNLALIRALLNLKAQDVNYAQSFAERGQTARLVASSATKFARGLSQLRKGNIEGFAESLGFAYSKKRKFKGIQEAWLETQYGWKPLLSDVHGIAKDLFEKDKASPNRYRVTVRGSANDASIKQLVNQVHSIGGDMRYDATQTLNRGSRCRLDYYQSNPMLGTLSSMGLTNPAELAWELLPWSFVADWFLPIGNYLSSWDADLGYSFCGGSVTDRYEWRVQNHRVYRAAVSCALNGVSYWESTGHDLYRKKVERRVYSSSPMPRFPGFKNPFSLVHAANAIALLGSAVR